MSEGKPSARDSAHEATGISTTNGEKDTRNDGLWFVLAVYTASRTFYFVAGTVFAGILPVGGESFRSSPDCLPSRCHKLPGCLVSGLRVNSLGSGR